jgi:hypothetical protein
MKTEYKIRVQETLDSIDKRASMLLAMFLGTRPSSQEEAQRLVVEIKKLVEHSRSLVDIS